MCSVSPGEARGLLRGPDPAGPRRPREDPLLARQERQIWKSRAKTTHGAPLTHYPPHKPTTPTHSVIDKAIIQNQAGAAPLEVSIVESFKVFLRNPVQFIRRPEVLMVWGVYGFTYMSANFINTTAKAFHYQPDVPRLIGTTVRMVGVCMACVSCGDFCSRSLAKLFCLELI